MDANRAVQYLEVMLDILRTNRAAFALKDEIFVSSTQWRDSQDQIFSRLPLVLAIADELDAAVADKIRDRSGIPWEWENAEEGVLELLGLLRHGEEFEAVLGRSDRAAGSFVHLHQGIWQNASLLWREGRFREAVKAGVGFVLGSLLPDKLDRHDLTGIDLVAEAFSIESPKPGRPRLRLPYLMSDTDVWETTHSAVKEFGIGCVLAARAVATDGLVEIDEDTALELLASLSAFARWIDQAVVARSGGVPVRSAPASEEGWRGRP